MVHPAPLCSSRTYRRLRLGCVLIAGLHVACSDDTSSKDQIGDNGNTGLTASSSNGTNTMGVTSASASTATTTAAAQSSSSASTGSSTQTTGAQTTGAQTTGAQTTGAQTTGAQTTGAQTTGVQTTGVQTTGAQTVGGTGDTSTGAGGASSSSGSTGGSPGDDFQPCPETGSCKILPLGDSITFGLGFDGGYRVHLFHLALADGHDVTFTGTQQPNGPNMVDGVTFPRNHEGISGETIEQIGNRIPTPGLNEMPHIILLHAGTNDMVRSQAGATDRLGALMDELTTEAPDALVVVSNIIPAPSFNSAIMTYNAPIEGMVEERASAGKHIVFSDQFSDFPDDGLGDPVHPNEKGYAAMAEAWYAVIKPYLR